MINTNSRGDLSMHSHNIYNILLMRNIVIQRASIIVINFNTRDRYTLVFISSPLSVKLFEVLRYITIHKRIHHIIMITSKIQILHFRCPTHRVKNFIYGSGLNSISIKHVPSNNNYTYIILGSIIRQPQEGMDYLCISG